MSIDRHSSTSGPRFVVPWRDEEGGHKKTFRRKMDAENFEARISTQRRDGTYIPPSRAEMSFHEWAEDHWWPSVVSSGLREKTIASYRGILDRQVMPRFGAMCLGNIRVIDVETWLGDLRTKGYANDTVRLSKSVLSKSLASAVRSKMITTNPCLGIKTPRSVPRSLALTHEQVEALISAIPEHYRDLFRLLAYYGLRPGEAAALRVEDLDDLDQLRISKSLSEVEGYLVETPTKTNRVRIVPLDPQTASALRSWIDSQRLLPGDRLFRGPNGGELRSTNLRNQVLAPVVRSLGLPAETSLYTLRHTAASMMASLGVAPTKAEAILGHSPTQFLNTYAHAYPSDLRDVTDLLAAARASRNNENIIPIRRSAD